MIDPRLTYVMRGGNHPNEEIEKVESILSEIALQSFFNSIHYQNKGLRWTYNWIYYNHLYSVKDPEMLKFIYKHRPFPSFIEVEVSTHCNLKCTMCEHTYWKEKDENMTFSNFIHILNQFPRLKWCGLTGIGESYLNPDFEKMLTECKRRGLFVEYR